MSTDFTVKGYRSAEDPVFKKHLRLLQICIEENVSLPQETAAYFSGDDRRPEGIDPDEVLSFKVPFQEVNPIEGTWGYEVALSSLPKGTEKIRFEFSS